MISRSLLLYLLPLLIVFSSCDSSEKEHTSVDPKEEKKLTEESQTPPKVEAGLEDPELFQYYHALCQSKEKPGFVDGTKIIQAYAKYPNPQYETAFEWEVSRIPTCTDTLLILELQSFTEGLIKEYEVEMDSKGVIRSFVLTGERLEAE